jgi:cytochrome c551/c552
MTFKIRNILEALRLLMPFLAFTTFGQTSIAQESPKEEDFFRIMKVSSPEGTKLEVGGLTLLPNGDLAVSTRRGDIFIVESPTSTRPHFRKFAAGLHEILGLAYKDGAVYCAQRGELTKLMDTDLDGRADVFETVYAWPLSGHYHEYSYGPLLAPDGSFFVSANVGFGTEEWWRGESTVPWRGWMMHIFEDGRMEPYATGFRSPCGLGMIDGEVFYVDNQGEWIASGGLVHVKKGSFVGHPAGLRWTSFPGSPVKLTTEQLYSFISPRQNKDSKGRYIKPENVLNEKFTTLFEAKQKFPELQTPAVWLPHGVLGISNSEILKIPENTFGPFSGQLLVGDQGQSQISRIFMEKINGEYQGAAWDFRGGFQSGVLRMVWSKDGSLFVGETNRGWGSAGEANDGLQRLVWNNKIPFEMRAVRAMPDGFEIEFTKPVKKDIAEDISSYSVQSFIYKYHPVYGSPTVNIKTLKIKGVKVSNDGIKAHIIVDGLRRYYIHQISAEGVRDTDNAYSLVHPTAYYTLNNIPEGRKLLMTEVSTKNSKNLTRPFSSSKKITNTLTKKEGAVSKISTNPTTKAPTATEIKPLLVKYTCASCHSTDKRVIGPSFKEMAKRKYSVDKIMSLIYNPQPQNWPGYSTEMPPMPQVPEEDTRKIAIWIASLQ